MINYQSVHGVITMIDEFWTGNPQKEGCYKLMTLQTAEGNIVNFVISPSTFFLDQFVIEIGRYVESFYDANSPVPLIYPPQYRALIVVSFIPFVQVKVDYFNDQLLSSDGSLKLNISPSIPITLTNGQFFNNNPANHYLIVMYDSTTKSIPAQTSPQRIIIVCPS